jgi:hypothetical protein
MLPHDPAAAHDYLVERFLRADRADLERISRALNTSGYSTLMRYRAEAEERAYALGRETPTRTTVRALGDRAQQVTIAAEEDWIGAELALHYALVGVATRDLISPAQFACLVSPFLTNAFAASADLDGSTV